MADIDISESPESRFNGSIDDLETKFEETRDDFFQIELQKGYFFDADLVSCWYAYEESRQDTGYHGNWTDIIYHVTIELNLDDGESCLSETIVYSIVLSKP